MSLPRLEQLDFLCSFGKGLFTLSYQSNAVGFSTLSDGLHKVYLG